VDTGARDAAEFGSSMFFALVIESVPDEGRKPFRTKRSRQNLKLTIYLVTLCVVIIYFSFRPSCGAPDKSSSFKI